MVVASLVRLAHNFSCDPGCLRQVQMVGLGLVGLGFCKEFRWLRSSWELEVSDSSAEGFGCQGLGFGILGLRVYEPGAQGMISGE